MGDLEVARLARGEESELREFLSACQESTFYHWPEWHAVVKEAYGHACEYWVARRGGRLIGAFPVSVVSRPGLGTKLVAIPYQLESGGPLGESDVVRRALVEGALESGRAMGARYLEVRGDSPLPWLEALGFVPIESHAVVTHVALADLDHRSFRRSRRQEVRQARDAGIVITEAERPEDLAAFRRLHLREDRAHGTPQLSRRFFEGLYAGRGRFARLYLARLDGRRLGGLLMLDDGRTGLGRYITRGTDEARRLRSDKALLWRVLFDASERGCRRFSLGSSWRSDPGVIWYKESWNGTSRPIYRYAAPIRSGVPAAVDYGEGFQLARAVWRRLPLPVVDLAGSWITQWVC
jgi:hypothetical protein